MSERISFKDELPDAFKRLVNLHQHIERAAEEEGLDPVLIELVKTRASQINGCAYCTDMHAHDGVRHGETRQRLALLPVWRETALFTAQERAALALAEAMTELPGNRTVPDAVYDQAAAVFTRRQLAVVGWAAAAIQTFNALNVTDRTPLPDERW